PALPGSVEPSVFDLARDTAGLIGNAALLNRSPCVDGCPQSASLGRRRRLSRCSHGAPSMADSRRVRHAQTLTDVGHETIGEELHQSPLNVRRWAHIASLNAVNFSGGGSQRSVTLDPTSVDTLHQ